MKTSNERLAHPSPSRLRWGRLDAILVLAAFLGSAALPSQAQTASGGDPPSRAARLSDVSGQVWIFSDDTGEWLTVERNRPLTTGDRLATDKGGRAEIRLGSTTLRLDSGTEIEVATLDDSRYAVRLASGSVAARLRSPQALAEFEIDTDEGRFRVLTVGRYRFDRRDQASDVTVYNGQAEYGANSTALPVSAGQHAQFWVDAAGVPQYAMVAPSRDAFSAWNDDRDRGEDRVATRPDPFVSPEMTGVEDLGRYGQWEQTPDYGPVWIPTAVAADWAPYSTGHWAWVRPWGWTWVDDAPWGFAPFHYGRWVQRRNVWCWAPGTYVARPVYAPALVAWIGGPRLGVSLAVGGPPVGWFPLAPREVYVPSYRASPRYVREVNITHVTDVTRITTIVNNRNGAADRRDFANRRLPHAVTFVPAEVMTRHQPVGPAAGRFRNDPQWRSLVADAKPAPALTAPPIAPPVAAPRPSAGGQVARPPFDGRAPGNVDGRSPGNFAGRPEGGRPDAGRPEFARPGRPNTPQPAVVGPVTSPPPVGAPATVVGPPTSPVPVGAPQGIPARGEPIGRGPAGFGGNSGRGGRDGSNPPLLAPSSRESMAPPVSAAPAQSPVMTVPAQPQSTGAPPQPRPAPAAAPEAVQPRMTIPTPVMRGQSADVGRVAPALRGREGMNGEVRGTAAPRQPDPIRPVEAVRPAPPVVATPQVVAPPAVPQVAAPQPVAPRAETRPTEPGRPAQGEPRMNRPEAPRAREDRREDRREEKADRPR